MCYDLKRKTIWYIASHTSYALLGNVLWAHTRLFWPMASKETYTNLCCSVYICRVYVFVLKVLCGLFDVNVSPAITLWCFNFWICRTSINCPVFHVKEKGSPLREFNISLSQKGSPHIRYVLFFSKSKRLPSLDSFFFLKWQNTFLPWIFL